MKNRHLPERRKPARSLIVTGMLAAVLSGCYYPVNGVRDANPGPTATPPWPYEEGTYPPGRSGPAAAYPGAPNAYGGPSPARSAPPAYAYDAARNQPSHWSSYDQGAYQAGRPAPAAAYPAAGPAYGGYPAPVPLVYTQDSSRTPPPPSLSVPSQYSDWLFDGPEGRGFAYYLAEGYRRYAKHEDNAHDFEDAAKFVFRAAAVERGEHIEPEQLSMRTLPAYAVDDLLYARQRLMQALGRGAAQRLPKLAANAQVAFDCWMEQQEENIQPHDVARCRRDFEAFIVRLEGVPDRPPLACATASCAPSAPCPAPICDSTPLIVHFDLGKYDLLAGGRSVIQQAAEQALQSAGRSLVVTAHTDRSGSDGYNDGLSKRRLDTVLEALLGAGVPRERLVRAEYFGENRPRVTTADGVREAENRRVEIRLSCAPKMAAEAPRCAASAPLVEPRCAGEPACGIPSSRGR